MFHKVKLPLWLLISFALFLFYAFLIDGIYGWSDALASRTMRASYRDLVSIVCFIGYAAFTVWQFFLQRAIRASAHGVFWAVVHLALLLVPLWYIGWNLMLPRQSRDEIVGLFAVAVGMTLMGRFMVGDSLHGNSKPAQGS